MLETECVNTPYNLCEKRASNWRQRVGGSQHPIWLHPEHSPTCCQRKDSGGQNHRTRLQVAVVFISNIHKLKLEFLYSVCSCSSKPRKQLSIPNPKIVIIANIHWQFNLFLGTVLSALFVSIYLVLTKT